MAGGRVVVARRVVVGGRVVAGAGVVVGGSVVALDPAFIADMELCLKLINVAVAGMSMGRKLVRQELYLS